MNALIRSEMLLGKPNGKHNIRSVHLYGRGGRAIFFVGQPDGKGTGWRFRLQGHRNWEGKNGQSFKRCTDAMIAGSAAWLRLGIYQ